MFELEFVRVSAAAMTWIKKNTARFEAFLDGELEEAEDRKLMKQIRLTLRDKEPFDVEDADLEGAVAALGADGKIVSSRGSSIITLSPAVVKRVKLPELLQEADVERLFKGAVKRGDHVLVTIRKEAEVVREAPKAAEVPKDRDALVAMLAARTGDDSSREEMDRLRKESLKLAGVDLSGVKLKDVLLWNADLSKADLSSSKLKCCELQDANLEGASFRDADLEMPSFDRARMAGADLTNAKIKDCSMGQADLSRISAQGLKLSTYGGVQFRAKLAGADLRKAKIDGAIYDSDFSKANLAGATLKGAQLLGSNFSGCDFTGADLREAGLQNANLTGAILDRAKLDGATYTKKTKWPGDPPKGAVLVRK
jgi:uncharacterized protein YjbI with pentapeptide repeats